MNEVEEGLQSYLIERSAAILKVDPEEIIWEADVDEYGFDSMTVNQLCFELSTRFKIYIQPVIFLEHSSLEAFSQHILAQHPEPIEKSLLENSGT